MTDANPLVEAINWNRLQDDKDLEIWNRLTKNFWLPEKIPLSNDVKSWNLLTDEEKDVTRKVFTGLTLLDTIQGTVGAISLIPDALTPHEEAVYLNIGFMEGVHAKSYSSIFSTLCSTREIDDAFRWSKENPYLQEKARIILKYYRGDDPLKRKVASTLLESFLFYSGFFWPFYLSSHGKLTNTADIIRLIVRDEALTDDHELLTVDGWKNISDITTDDIVAQYHNETGHIDFAHPTNVSHHWEDYTWDFTSARGEKWLSTSPHHRMLFHTKNGGNVTAPASEAPISSRHSSWLILTGQATGHIDSLTTKQRMLIGLLLNSTITDDVAQFTFEKRDDINQNIKNHLAELVEQLGWDAHIGDRTAEVTIPSGLMNNITRMTDITPRLDHLSAKGAHDILTEINVWAGYRAPYDENTLRYLYAGEEGKNLVQALAVLAGHTSQNCINNEDNCLTKETQTVECDKTRGYPTYSLRQTKAEGREVYAVSVPSTYLVTRCDYKVSITGNCVHGYYIGYKYQKGLELETPERREELKQYTHDLLFELYDNEVKYTHELYDGLGLSEEVISFLHYNANKALMNLGYEAIFPEAISKVQPSIMSSLAPDANENHDFFSGSGSSYVICATEETTDDDWAF